MLKGTLLNYILPAKVLERRKQDMSKNANFQRWKQVWPSFTDPHIAEITQVLIKSNQWETPMWHLNVPLIQVQKSRCHHMGSDHCVNLTLSGSWGRGMGYWAVRLFLGGRAWTFMLRRKSSGSLWGLQRSNPLGQGRRAGFSGSAEESTVIQASTLTTIFYHMS